jgi:hypothetical protein
VATFFIDWNLRFSLIQQESVVASSQVKVGMEELALEATDSVELPDCVARPRSCASTAFAFKFGRTKSNFQSFNTPQTKIKIPIASSFRQPLKCGGVPAPARDEVMFARMPMTYPSHAIASPQTSKLMSCTTLHLSNPKSISQSTFSHPSQLSAWCQRESMHASHLSLL